MSLSVSWNRVSRVLLAMVRSRICDGAQARAPSQAIHPVSVPMREFARSGSAGALQIRRGRLVGQDANGVLDGDQGLGLRTQAADGDHAVFRFLPANHGDDRDLA